MLHDDSQVYNKNVYEHNNGKYIKYALFCVYPRVQLSGPRCDYTFGLVLCVFSIGRQELAQ